MKKQKWLVLEEDSWQIVIPDTDIKCHGFPEGKSKKVDIAGFDCPCKPKINYLDKVIVHNSFQDIQKINESLIKIF